MSAKIALAEAAGAGQEHERGSPTVVVTAIRSPAMISGSASGSSTRHSSWRCVRPMPRPASRASAGTPSRPAMTLRKRISSV